MGTEKKNKRGRLETVKVSIYRSLQPQNKGGGIPYPTRAKRGVYALVNKNWTPATKK